MYTFENYVQLRQADFKCINKFVKENLAASRETLLTHQHQRASTPDIMVGDILFSKVQDHHSKLDAKFKDPLQDLTWQRIERVRSEDTGRKIE